MEKKASEKNKSIHESCKKFNKKYSGVIEQLRALSLNEMWLNLLKNNEKKDVMVLRNAHICLEKFVSTEKTPHSKYLSLKFWLDEIDNTLSVMGTSNQEKAIFNSDEQLPGKRSNFFYFFLLFFTFF